MLQGGALLLRRISCVRNFVRVGPNAMVSSRVVRVRDWRVLRRRSYIEEAWISNDTSNLIAEAWLWEEVRIEAGRVDAFEGLRGFPAQSARFHGVILTHDFRVK